MASRSLFFPIGRTIAGVDPHQQAQGPYWASALNLPRLVTTNHASRYKEESSSAQQSRCDRAWLRRRARFIRGRRAEWVRRKPPRTVHVDFRPGLEPRQREQGTGESRRVLCPAPCPTWVPSFSPVLRSVTGAIAGVKQRARVRCKWAMGAVERRSPLQAEGSVSPAKSRLATRDHANRDRPTPRTAPYGSNRRPRDTRSDPRSLSNVIASMTARQPQPAR